MSFFLLFYSIPLYLKASEMAAITRLPTSKLYHQFTALITSSFHKSLTPSATLLE